MERKKRPVAKMVNLVAGSGSWVSPDFLDQRVKFLKNRKMKNAPGFLILFRVIKKNEHFQKNVFCVFDCFRVL